ncbi:MAG: M23 family metallopeptidase [Pseudomonadota bacterium]|uniref:M23 family metallopeptidase n=1 Tax=Rhizorhabdus phycosphaerae TaxID=2711156 RepID=UPI001D01969F|nr:M23 family metallopeptidase [Rhizorhabdus phycosphaerae]
MRPARRALALLPVLLAIAGCTTAPVSPPTITPPTAPAARVVDNADFHLSGRIEQGGLAFGMLPGGAAQLMLGGKPVPVAPDGRFLVGFDRDAGPGALLEAVLADGTIWRRALVVAPRAWQIESLPTLPRGTTPTPEFLARRKIELERIAAARAQDSGSVGWRQRFTWPVTGRISGVFGSQRIYAGEPGSFHSGVDVARPTGTPVAAPADGVVILAASAPFSLEGNLLMIDHGMGLNSAFLHLSRIDVVVGQAVRQGDIVGAVGMTGRATGPHLHWSMKWRDARVDPAPIAGPMP